MWSPRSLIAWFWTLVVFGLCWTPRQLLPVREQPGVPFLFASFDKFVHFALCAGFAFLWMFTGKFKARSVLVAGIAASVLSEVGQALPIINRDAEWPDGLADILGVLVGCAIYQFGGVFFPTPRNSPNEPDPLP